MKHDIENANYCITFEKLDHKNMHYLYERQPDRTWIDIRKTHSKLKMKIIRDLYGLSKGFIHKGAIWGIYYYE